MNRNHFGQSDGGNEDFFAGHVDLWYTACDEIEEHQFDSYWDLLSADEAARARRFHFQRDRRLFLAAHAMLRIVLSRYSALDPRQLKFFTQGNGKPYLIAAQNPPPALQFNLSHTRGLAVCAVTRDCEIGVDIENLDRRPNVNGLAHRYFATAEAADVTGLGPELQHGRFFEYWTLKESYIKAIGTGLATPLDQFAFELGSDGPPRISFVDGVDERPEDWQFAQFQIGAGFQGALAIRGAKRLSIAAAKTVPLADAGTLQALPHRSDYRWQL